MECGEVNTRVLWRDAFVEDLLEFGFEVRLGFFCCGGKRVESKLGAVEEKCEFGYFSSGNKPFGIWIF